MLSAYDFILTVVSSVTVEKLLRAKFAKIELHQDALQTTFSVFLDIFYPPNFGCFAKNGVFQQPQAITLHTRSRFEWFLIRECLFVHHVRHLGQIAAIVAFENVHQTLHAPSGHALIGIG